MLEKTRIIGKILLNDEQRAFLKENKISNIFDDNPKKSDDYIINLIGDAEAIMINISTPISEAVLNACPQLQFIQTWSTGLDHIDMDACEKKGIIVKNNDTFSMESIAEKTIGLMILIANRLKEANTSVQDGQWLFTEFQGMELKGKTLLIIGYGRIGQRVAEIAKILGMNILKTNSTTSQKELKSHCSQADVISIHCPLTKKTKYLIDQSILSYCKKGCLLVNTSRGAVINEDDLLDALNNGTVKAAALDVLEEEPPKKGHPLIHHDRVFVTPHITWHTKEAVQYLSQSSIDSLVEFFKDKS